MGLFERIRQREQEEVELQPSDTRRRPQDREDEAEDDEPEEFLLPGMASDEEDEAGRKRSRGSTRSSRSRSTGNGRDGEASLERIAAQNERIIELLEQLVDGDDDSPAVPW